MDQQQIYQYVTQCLAAGHQPQAIVAQLTGHADPNAIAMVMQQVLQQPAAPALPPAPQFQQQQYQAPASFGGQGQSADNGGSLSPQQVQRYGERLGSAKAGNAHGRQLPAGTHLVEVTEVRAGPTYYGDKFFIEYIARESTNAEVEIGGVYSKGYNFEDKYGHGPNDIRGWLCIAVEHKLGQNARVTWDPRFLDWAINASQPCKGMMLRVETWERQPTKAGGNVVSIHEWQAQPAGTTTLGLRAQAHAPAAPPQYHVQQLPHQPAMPPAPPAPMAPPPPNPAALVQSGAFAPPPPGFGQPGQQYAPPPGSFPPGPPPQFGNMPAPGGPPPMPPHIQAMMGQAR